MLCYVFLCFVFHSSPHFRTIDRSFLQW